ncbi:MAG: hypothetical protein KDA51_18715, partial [Planctomycetales bacterium]|nr:hypothetical protein [Planctomycetales bacterium]
CQQLLWRGTARSWGSDRHFETLMYVGGGKFGANLGASRYLHLPIRAEVPTPCSHSHAALDYNRFQTNSVRTLHIYCVGR